MTISFWRSIISKNSHLLIALSIATVISCARINADRLSDSPVIPQRILEMIPSDKQIHVILPVLPGRMIPGREMLDKIERMIVNAVLLSSCGMMTDDRLEHALEYAGKN